MRGKRTHCNINKCTDNNIKDMSSTMIKNGIIIDAEYNVV